MGLGKFVNGRYQPISQYKGSWADTIHKTTVPQPPVPAILANEERRRQFLMRYPYAPSLGAVECGALWDRFVADYADGITRIAVDPPRSSRHGESQEAQET